MDNLLDNQPYQGKLCDYYNDKIFGLIMLSPTSNYSACTRCDFSPFCIAEETDSSWSKSENIVVKQHRTLKRNEVLCLPKNKFHNFYVVQWGSLKTYQAEAEGNELIRGFYFAGEVLGYEAIYTGHYLYSVVALSETVVCEIPYNKLLDLMQTRPDLQKRILHSISQQLNTGSYLVSTCAEQRVAAFLIDLSVRLHPSKIQSEFILPMSRQDIGNYLRLTAETISRILSRFQKSHLIEINHKKIRLVQIEQLKKIADAYLD